MVHWYIICIGSSLRAALWIGLLCISERGKRVAKLKIINLKLNFPNLWLYFCHIILPFWCSWMPWKVGGGGCQVHQSLSAESGEQDHVCKSAPAEPHCQVWKLGMGCCICHGRQSSTTAKSLDPEVRPLGIYHWELRDLTQVASLLRASLFSTVKWGSF